MRSGWIWWMALAVAFVVAFGGCEQGAKEKVKDDKPAAEKSDEKKGVADKGEAADKKEAVDEKAAPGDEKPVVVDDAPPVSVKLHPALADVSLATEKAPASFKVRFTTTKGDFVFQATREWSPIGVDRLYNLVRIGFFTDLPIFRVVTRFVAQFGIHGTPSVSAVWSEATIKDDPVTQTNARGTMVFATAGPNTRSSQFFINFADNGRLDGMGFSPLGKVIEGMDVVDTFYAGYGDGPPRGTGPDQGRMGAEGNVYLKGAFTELDYILEAVIIE